ncbi:hypothetical protein BJ165DRAFT_1334721 [Panaeolus papilionaceus]|nr:hypothetical protein BJ165DRAFT_1334721 [Panaeolus papilionaceus]
MSREEKRADVERAYQIQSEAATKGAARFFAIGLGTATILNHLSPFFRRQTLAMKGFFVTTFTVTGLVFYAEHALLEHENIRRREENIIRKEARLDLARRGLVPTETEIAKWKAERSKEKTTR